MVGVTAFGHNKHTCRTHNEAWSQRHSDQAHRWRTAIALHHGQLRRKRHALRYESIWHVRLQWDRHTMPCSVYARSLHRKNMRSTSASASMLCPIASTMSLSCEKHLSTNADEFRSISLQMAIHFTYEFRRKLPPGYFAGYHGQTCWLY